jgi:class 3 adenylate cyclase
LAGEYHRAAAQAIERFGGHVAQYLGDGVMAYFGYPEAHDNDAERAAATHTTPAIKRWLLRHPRFHLHFTPTGASWLNLVERWFATLTEKQLRRGVHRSTAELEQAIRKYLHLYNRDPKPFIWHKIADQILESVARFCQCISDSGH